MYRNDANRKKPNLEYLKHICHIDNLASILEHGILSYNEVHKKFPLYSDISSNKVQQRRTVYHDHASLYVQSKNSMLYKLGFDIEMQKNIIILLVNPEIVKNEGVYFSDGNLAANDSILHQGYENISKLDWDLLDSASWTDNENIFKSVADKEKKRKMSSEVLVYNMVNPEDIDGIACVNMITHEKVSEIVAESNRNNSIKIIMDKEHPITKRKYFFYPNYKFPDGTMRMEKKLNADKKAEILIENLRNSMSKKTENYDN